MKELLFRITKKDLNLTFFSGKGAGGQHRNKHQNCVRLNHKDSGTMVTGQSHKSKSANIKEALDNLTKHTKFKLWHNDKVQEHMHKIDMETFIDGELVESNIKIEMQKEEKWVEYIPENKREEPTPTPKYLHKATKEKRRSKKRNRVRIPRDESYHDYEGGE